MLKNCIYISGNDSYGVEQEVKRWLLAFSSKYGDINIERVRIEEVKNPNDLYDILFSGGLFSEKRLFIFSGGREKKSKTTGIETVFEKYGALLPEDHFCLFHNLKDSEEPLKKWLHQYADTRIGKDVWEKSIWESRFPDIPAEVIHKSIEGVRQSEQAKEEGERNTLVGHSLYAILRKIQLGDTQEDTRHMGGKVFDLIDAILGADSKKALTIFTRISQGTSGAELLQSLISLLRSALYIKYLFSKGYKKEAIERLIKVHPFVFKKAETARIHREELQSFLQKLYSANIAYKSGKGMKDTELGRIFSIELALIGLKK